MATQERFPIEKKYAARSLRRERCLASVSGPFPWILTSIVSMSVTFINTYISSGASMALKVSIYVTCIRTYLFWHACIALSHG